MSIEAEGKNHEQIIEELLEKILNQLALLNVRFEEAFDTGIELDELEE